MPFIAIALIVAAAIGGGTSVAAQNALPGDALWSFKININEKVGAAIAPEGKAQANFDIAALEARMKEASALAADGRLHAQAQAHIEANFEAHARNVALQIEKLQDKGDFEAAAEVAARFQAAVATNASALVDADIQDATTLLSKVRGTLEAASSISADASLRAAEATGVVLLQ